MAKMMISRKELEAIKRVYSVAREQVICDACFDETGAKEWVDILDTVSKLTGQNQTHRTKQGSSKETWFVTYGA